jgi:hypothetical protein
VLRGVDIDADLESLLAHEDAGAGACPTRALVYTLSPVVGLAGV